MNKVITILIVLVIAGVALWFFAQQTVDYKPDLLPAAEAVKNHISQEEGVAKEEMDILRVIEKEWPDLCLGLPEEDEACAEAITPGYEVMLEAGRVTYTYRTDIDGSIIRFYESFEEFGIIDENNDVTDDPNGTTDESENGECAKEGENFSFVFTNTYPKKCCEGLTEWDAGMDTRISIGNECYNTMMLSGNPVGICINCGDGICGPYENVCNCPEDCGPENSRYKTVEEFCNSPEAWRYQPLFNLCE